MKIIQKFAGTKIYDVLINIETIYSEIDVQQADWKKATPSPCPEGCGHCCENFEPDVYESEALYLAAWMLENQYEKAEYIRQYGIKNTLNKNGCFLFDPLNVYHCTVYAGRCLICRLFAHSSVRSKNNDLHWRPCKFIQPTQNTRCAWEHREYTETELKANFKAIPPDMTSISMQLMSLTPDDRTTKPLHQALPMAIQKLKMLLSFLEPNDNESPEPDLPSPSPLSA